MIRVRVGALLSVCFLTTLILFFGNCAKIEGNSLSQSSLLVNTLENGEKAIYVWNKVTYEHNPVVLFANRTEFSSASIIDWTLNHEDGAYCTIIDSPNESIKDWIQFDCEEAGKLDITLIVTTPKETGSEDYEIALFETTIYLKISTTVNEFGITEPLLHSLEDLFPDGNINPPDENISGGGGYDPVGSGTDLDPRFLLGLQVYSARCAVCHNITGDPTGDGDDNDNARRYFRLRRDYYAEYTTGDEATRESRAIAAALRRIRIGLASDTFAMWNADEVKELFLLETDSEMAPQMDAFSFNESKSIFGNRFVDINTLDEANSNSLTGLENVFQRNELIDPDPANDAPDDGNPDTTTDNDGIPDNDFVSTAVDFGVDLNNNDQGLTPSNNSIPANVNFVEVLQFNDDGSLASGTVQYPVVEDIFVEPDVDGEDEVFRIPRADFNYDLYEEELEALIIYIVETL